MKFPESRIAHLYLDGLDGIEIGGSAHNPFGLKTRNVDYTADMATVFKLAEVEVCGEAMPVDIVANGADLPLLHWSVDFVISSHVFEHFYDPIAALIEWDRVVKVGGFIMAIVPKRDALAEDVGRPLTHITELIARHAGPPQANDDHRHWSVMTHIEGRDLLFYMQTAEGMRWRVRELMPTDDKVGNGWCFIVEKTGTRLLPGGGA